MKQEEAVDVVGEEPSPLELERMLFVSEIFGPVWQGEGRQAGQVCTFLRLFGCNLSCRWCDTPYTWAVSDRRAELHITGKKYDIAEERHRMSIAQVVEQLQSLSARLVVISGGEPMLQVARLEFLIPVLQDVGFKVAVETAGTIDPLTLAFAHGIQWTVSPKLSSSQNAKDKRYKPDILDIYRDMHADFKFVIASSDDLFEAQRIVEDHGINRAHVWIMPEGIDADTIIRRARAIAPKVEQLGWNLTLRQHVLLYGDQRGR